MSWTNRLAIAAVALFLLVILVNVLSPPKSRADQIKEGCAREFESEGEQRINECAITLMTRELGEQEAAKLDRAAR